jgi:hypothetical protein
MTIAYLITSVVVLLCCFVQGRKVTVRLAETGRPIVGVAAGLFVMACGLNSICILASAHHEGVSAVVGGLLS